MEVILAKTAGFCFGVKRAVDTVYKRSRKEKCIHIRADHSQFRGCE